MKNTSCKHRAQLFKCFYLDENKRKPANDWYKINNSKSCSCKNNELSL